MIYRFRGNREARNGSRAPSIGRARR